MELQTFCYHKSTGWTVPTFPKLTSTEQMVLLFGAPGFLEDPAPLQELAKAYPAAKCIGCSTAGEIFNGSLQDESLSVALVGFETTTLEATHFSIAGMDESYNAGVAVASALQVPDAPLRGVLILSDGLNVNGSELVRGVNTSLGDDVVVTGGLAADGPDFGRTWVWKDGSPTQGFVSAIGFYGLDIRIGHGSKGGWDKFGPERRVTRAESNVLYELDEKPALALYKEYLGDRAKDLPASGLLFPLALLDGSDKILVRTILAVDEEAQSLTFAGDIPQGSKVRLMKTNIDRLIQGAEDAAMMTANRGEDNPTTLAIAISCVGRRMVMGERVEDEIEASLDALPSGTRQVGFYSYGEISSFAKGKAGLHNQTMTLTTLHETSKSDTE